MERAQELNLRAGELGTERNRALRAALAAELRKEKLALGEELEALARLARGAGEGRRGADAPPPAEVLRERLERVEEAAAIVADIPDGSGTPGVLRPQRALSGLGAGPSGSASGRIDLDPSLLSASASAGPGAYEHTGETRAFVRDATMAAGRQEIALDNIERGLSTLKELGGAMGEELERHDVLIDEVGAKMDAVTRELGSNNAKLKGIVTQVRSTRRFFIDIILIIVALAIGLYIYTIVT
jgi:SYP7 family syntaxin